MESSTEKIIYDLAYDIDYLGDRSFDVNDNGDIVFQEENEKKLIDDFIDVLEKFIRRFEDRLNEINK